MNYFIVGIGGAVGASLRYLICTVIPYSGGFPLATCLINIVGSFLLAVLLTSQSLIQNKQLKLLLTTGFLGAFTTFSAFSYETFTLFHTDSWLAIVYIMISILGGLSASLIGTVLVKGGSL
ncbi:fluoride efflux transporter CrcB [Solibacillus sp. CAU 1738]|uniref:fluoride efflux transporter CrcB n=1 Tax=Solibacillus sp. CAU 1738 TaxID=3140363 RepID=UPI003260D3F1